MLKTGTPVESENLANIMQYDNLERVRGSMYVNITHSLEVAYGLPIGTKIGYIE